MYTHGEVKRTRHIINTAPCWLCVELFFLSFNMCSSKLKLLRGQDITIRLISCVFIIPLKYCHVLSSNLRVYKKITISTVFNKLSYMIMTVRIKYSFPLLWTPVLSFMRNSEGVSEKAEHAYPTHLVHSPSF